MNIHCLLLHYSSPALPLAAYIKYNQLMMPKFKFYTIWNTGEQFEYGVYNYVDRTVSFNYFGIKFKLRVYNDVDLTIYIFLNLASTLNMSENYDSMNLFSIPWLLNGNCSWSLNGENTSQPLTSEESILRDES